MDFLITNATLVDSQKKKTSLGGVAVVESRIVEVYSEHSSVPVDHFDRVIDAKEKYLIPGFFDVHSRCDLSSIHDPSRISALAQGVNVEVIGQDGFSVAPISHKNYLLHSQHVVSSLGNPQLKWKWETVFQYLDLLHLKTASNILFYSPHGTMRLEASLNPVLSSTGLNALEYVFEKSLDDGSIGLSISTSKSPSNIGWNDERELNALLKILKKKDGILCVNIEVSKNHLKDVDKAISLARSYGVRLHLSRLAANNSEHLESILSIIDKRKKELKNIIVDMSPYASRLIKIYDIIPEFMKTYSQEELRVKLKRPENVKAIFNEIKFTEEELEKFKLVTTSKRDMKKHENEYLENIAMERDESIHDILLSFMLFDPEKTYFEYEVIKPAALTKAFDIPFVLPASTGHIDGRYLPDIFTFVPSYFNTFSKDQISDLVSKLSEQAADFYNVKWGIKRGLKANFILLDKDKFHAESDYIEPRVSPDGVELNVINGRIAWEKGKSSGSRTGEVLSWS